jgi:hypothetical protein
VLVVAVALQAQAMEQEEKEATLNLLQYLQQEEAVVHSYLIPQEQWTVVLEAVPLLVLLAIEV